MGAVGLDRCVAADEPEYVAAAAGLAGDVAALREIRLGLRDRMAASPLRDGAGLARRVEAAYGAMWRAHVTASAN
jgi:predicted O-linked N-acetylglucosamine transferase (SPINDLY family)